MKKVYYMLAALLVMATACGKDDPTPGPDTPVDDPIENPGTKEEAAALTLVSDAIVDLPAESGFYTVKFSTNKDWTAEVANAEEGTVILGAQKGEKGDNIELKVTYQNVPDDVDGRMFDLLLKAGDKSQTVHFFQGMVFDLDTDRDPSLGPEGGKLEVTILTNMEVQIKKYDGVEDAFPWASVAIKEEDHKINLSFDVEANQGYDARTAYVKFTLPQIQVPVLDDEGNDTGELQDYVTRFYVEQEGHAQLEWKVFLDEGFNVGDGATASLAFFDGKLLVCDASTIHIVNPETGAFEGTMDTGVMAVHSIANDDAGNLLLANLGEYGALFDVYAVRAGSHDASTSICLIHFVNEAWSGSTGIDKVAARGDVFHNGVVSAIYGGVQSYGGLTYTLYWAISGGKAEQAYYNEWNPVVNPTTSGWLTTPALADDLWLSNRAAFVPAGPSVDDGFFYGGYDGLYNVLFYNGADWQVSIEGAGNWAGGPQGMHGIVWNEKKILVVAQMGYVWWAEGWGMPAYLWVADVSDPASPEVLSCAEYNNGLAQTISGDTENSTVDVVPVVVGNDLVVYYVDTAQGHLVKVRFPKL